MKLIVRPIAIFAALFCFQCALPINAAAQTSTQQGDHRMTNRATGSFNVSMKPASQTERSGRSTLGRMLLEKQYFGDFIATAKGEMLTAVTDTKGSASYVAMEWVTGTLHGRQGSFVLHHTGNMAGGAAHLSVEIVPDSGTEQLTGITGQLTIKVVEGKHFYELEYSLPQ